MLRLYSTKLRKCRVVVETQSLPNHWLNIVQGLKKLDLRYSILTNPWSTKTYSYLNHGSIPQYESLPSHSPVIQTLHNHFWCPWSMSVKWGSTWYVLIAVIPRHSGIELKTVSRKSLIFLGHAGFRHFKCKTQIVWSQQIQIWCFKISGSASNNWEQNLAITV